MRILVGKTFGIGNAVLSVPLIKALATLGDVEILVGTGPDDGGAYDVLVNLVGTHASSVWRDRVPLDRRFDVAIMAIPFDGRWSNGVHFTADRVIDGRPRPDPQTFGFSSWHKHEAEYQMESAELLGYNGPLPDLSFRKKPPSVIDGRVYLGVGYKRDQSGFWKKKHWGNDRYVRFILEVAKLAPHLSFATTGNESDVQNSIEPIWRDSRRGLHYIPTFGLNDAFDRLAASQAYFGNDTGMMHVAAAYDLPVYAMFGLSTTVKNPPICTRAIVEPFNIDELPDWDPEVIAERFVRFIG